ncbi:RNA ligase [Yinghuangia aomiensis]
MSDARSGPEPRPLSALMSPTALADEVAGGFVRRTRHPELPLSVYAYTARCFLTQHWTPVTRWTRGLIVDDAAGTIAAQAFPKFFNAEQHTPDSPFAPPLPADEPFELYDKVDGSLGIVFHHAGRWHAATKSSFTSPQAVWAQAWLDAHDTGALSPGTTYLAEVVYPENRIVVDHGSRSTLVLLGGYGPDGAEVRLADLAAAWHGIGDVVGSHRPGSLAGLLHGAANNVGPDGRPLAGTEAEGWVVRFASGVRAKVKLGDYVRLHATMTRTNERGVWEVLSRGGDPAELFDRMPDEFRAWILTVAARLTRERDAWSAAAHAAFAAIGPAPDRPAFARKATDPSLKTYRAALFLLYDNRPIDELAWRAVRPATAGVPFLVGDPG